MTKQEIADRLIELCNQGDFETVYKELYSPEIVSIEPKGAIIETAHGFEGIAEKGKKWRESVQEFHGQKIGTPVFSDDHFAFPWTSEITFKGGQRVTFTEMCVYEVKDGKIVKEQFFYAPMPS